MSLPEVVKPTGDILAAGTTVGVVLKVLPAIAALFTIVWTAARLYEMFTGRPFSESKFAKWVTRQ